MISFVWMVNVAVRGVDTANNWVYSMVLQGVIDKAKGVIYKKDASELPI